MSSRLFLYLTAILCKAVALQIVAMIVSELVCIEMARQFIFNFVWLWGFPNRSHQEGTKGIGWVSLNGPYGHWHATEHAEWINIPLWCTEPGHWQTLYNFKPGPHTACTFIEQKSFLHWYFLLGGCLGWEWEYMCSLLHQWHLGTQRQLQSWSSSHPPGNLTNLLTYSSNSMRSM